MITLNVQNGHRNNPNGQTGTSGTTSSGVHLYEVDMIDKIAGVMADKLKAYADKITVYLDDATITHGDVDYFIAIHMDGSSDPTVRGGFVDDAPQCPNNGVTPCDLLHADSMKFAQTISDYYFPKIGIPYRNGQTANSTYYYGFNYTGANTKQFLIELGCMTNTEDMDKLQDYQYIGSLLAEGFLWYLQKYDSKFNAQKAPTTQTNNSSTQPAILPVSQWTQDWQVKAVAANEDVNSDKYANFRNKDLSIALAGAQEEVTSLQAQMKVVRQKALDDVRTLLSNYS